MTLDKLTLDQILNNSAAKYENNIALSSVNGDTVTYKQLKEKVNSVSEFLHEKGVLTGDKVAILSENSVNWGIAYFAITTMGAVGVPIMTEFKPTEIHHILRHSECKVIFVSSKQYEKIEEFNTAISNYHNESNPVLKKIAIKNIERMSNIKSEYSGMIKSILEKKGFKYKTASITNK